MRLRPVETVLRPEERPDDGTGCGVELDDGAVVEVSDEEVRPGHDHVDRILEAPSEHVDTPATDVAGRAPAGGQQSRPEMSAVASTTHWAATRRGPAGQAYGQASAQAARVFHCADFRQPVPRAQEPPTPPLTLWVQDAINEGSDRPSDERSDDEYPQLAESVASDEQRRTDAPCGVDRGPVDRDTDEMDQRESEADHEARH